MKIKCPPRIVALVLCMPFLVTLPACDRRAATSIDKERTAGEEVDDKTITANVKSSLSADSVKYPDVQVAVYRGVVQLSGFVDTREQKSRATDLAQNIPGVRKVENSISLKEVRKP